MQCSDSIAKLSVALAKAQAHFRAVGKSGHNTFDRYTYANLEDYVHAVRPVLAEHGLAVVSSADEVVALEDRTTQKGGRDHAVRVKVSLRIVHESGEWIETIVWGEGQDRADKAVYKAITGARKYGLALLFGLATSDDPEADEQVGRTPAPPQSSAPTPLATPEQVRELKDLLSVVRLPEGTVDKWLAKAGVNEWEDMPRDLIDKCIEYAKNRLPSAHAA